MQCGQCQGIEDLFNEKNASRELRNYRKKGPDKTTQILIDALITHGVQGLSLLDIGGGIGALQHELLQAGVLKATDVDASQAYLKVAKDEAQRRGLGGRVHYLHGDFVDLSPQITQSGIVTLDRVICCYHNMHELVGLSADRAGKLYGVVYPRDTWWMKVAAAFLNLFFRLRRKPFRSYVHSTRDVDTLIRSRGLKLLFYEQTLVWQMAVYGR